MHNRPDSSREEDFKCQGVLRFRIFVVHEKGDWFKKPIVGHGSRCGEDHLQVLQASRIGLLFHLKRWLDQYSFAFERPCLEVDESAEWISGKLAFCDSIQDEWFLVFLLREVTRTFSGLCMCTVSDNDGQFLLIEGADFLPSWVTPENADDRVFLYKGRVHAVSIDQVQPQDGLLQRCVEFVAKHESECVVSEELEREIWAQYVTGRLPYPGIFESKHRFTCMISDTAALLFDKHPRLVALSCHAFYHRDPHSLAKASKMKKFDFGKSEFRQAQIVFPRIAYAQLVGQRFRPSESLLRSAPFYSQIIKRCIRTDDMSEWSKLMKSAFVGFKLMIGLEMLYNDLAQKFKRDDDCFSEVSAVAEDLIKKHPFLERFPKSAFCESKTHIDESDSYLLDCIEDVCRISSPCKLAQKADPPDDDDSWLCITPEAFDNVLEAANMNRLEACDFESESEESVSSDSEPDALPSHATNKNLEAMLEPVNLNFDEIVKVLKGDVDLEYEEAHREDTQYTDNSVTFNEAAEAMEEQLQEHPELGRPSLAVNGNKNSNNDLDPVDLDLDLVKDFLESCRLADGATDPALELVSGLERKTRKSD